MDGCVLLDEAAVTAAIEPIWVLMAELFDLGVEAFPYDLYCINRYLFKFYSTPSISNINP